ncbi:MAG: DUF4167 domain-containing protein [Alphaproteobacteria bacterium]|nr:DUF4167 domain-containing protein [Bartonella sp. TP]MDN5249255.1 DUF4167 domain-containing protein [Alphaproteobacteria bacterium]WJW79658.1 DUF4167 domain-containing protein [Bartonella sp. TP]
MRPQQNRRVNNKHRPNLNRKTQNPLSKTFESNGPGIKIRGNAQHIYEKYIALARDAQATGDNIIAENFLQHAEHYKRIIIEATANQQIYNQEFAAAEINIEPMEQFMPQTSSEELEEDVGIAEEENTLTVKKPNNKRPPKQQKPYMPNTEEDNPTEVAKINNKKPNRKSGTALKKKALVEDNSDQITV